MGVAATKREAGRDFARVAQEAADAYERSRTGGVFFLAVWVLICATAGQAGLRELAIGALFASLALARLAAGRIGRATAQDQVRRLFATYAVMLATMACWGGTTAFALSHPDYAATPTVILFATSAFTTAYVHNYPMRLAPAVAGILAGYGPPFAALLASARPGALPIAIGVFIHSSYLVLAARRAHYEYHRSLDLEQQLREQRDRFAHRSRIDALTGLANRGEFNEQLLRAVEQATAQPQATVALLILDVDHFKAVNDARGHAIGDACLAAIAALLAQRFAPPAALPARLGGEEFAVLLPDCDLATARDAAESLRLAIAAQPLELEGTGVALTVSIGVGIYRPDRHQDADALYRDVDGALYRAKGEGRNRVVAAAPAAVAD
jgi:diguanylate cyclase (GGDEF)-like protein